MCACQGTEQGEVQRGVTGGTWVLRGPAVLWRHHSSPQGGSTLSGSCCFHAHGHAAGWHLKRVRISVAASAGTLAPRW
jgi:hypothetical protein